jgi:hypothetical protein
MFFVKDELATDFFRVGQSGTAVAERHESTGASRGP